MLLPAYHKLPMVWQFLLYMMFLIGGSCHVSNNNLCLTMVDSKISIIVMPSEEVCIRSFKKPIREIKTCTSPAKPGLLEKTT